MLRYDNVGFLNNNVTRHDGVRTLVNELRVNNYVCFLGYTCTRAAAINLQINK